MPADPITSDGDAFVAPGYLAGPSEPGTATHTAWPLPYPTNWPSHIPPNGWILHTSPCQRIRLGVNMTGPDRGQWRTAAYFNPFEQPSWTASFAYGMPEELIADFHRPLLNAYEDEAGHVMYGDDLPATLVYLPLLNEDWAHDLGPNKQVFTSPDGCARLTHLYDRPIAETGWLLTVGTLDEQERWTGSYTASFTVGTPVALLKALTDNLAAGGPLTRTFDQIPTRHRPHVQTSLDWPAPSSVAAPSAAAPVPVARTGVEPTVPGPRR